MKNHQGETDLYLPEVKVSLQYIADGKLLDYPMHSEGLFKGRFSKILNNASKLLTISIL